MMNNPKQYSRKKIFICAVSLVLVIVFSFLIYVDAFFGIPAKSLYSFFGIREFSSNADTYPLSVHFIDVGCGDSILIKCGDRTALIDTGSFSLNGKTQYYLKHSGVTKLDLFVATHTDSDHIGDFVSVADNFEIDNLWISNFCTDKKSDFTESEKLFFEKISEKNINFIYPECKTYPFGSAELQVMSPSKKYDDDNDNSLVIKLTYKNVSYLFTGDSGEKSETQMLNENTDLRSTVLKVSHHGSSSATSQKFLNAVLPEYAVISAGDENKYLPNRKTVDRLKNSGAEILRTDRNGNIIVATDGNNISVFCEKT